MTSQQQVLTQVFEPQATQPQVFTQVFEPLTQVVAPIQQQQPQVMPNQMITVSIQDIMALIAMTSLNNQQAPVQQAPVQQAPVRKSNPAPVMNKNIQKNQQPKGINKRQKKTNVFNLTRTDMNYRLADPAIQLKAPTKCMRLYNNEEKVKYMLNLHRYAPKLKSVYVNVYNAFWTDIIAFLKLHGSASVKSICPDLNVKSSIPRIERCNVPVEQTIKDDNGNETKGNVILGALHPQFEGLRIEVLAKILSSMFTYYIYLENNDGAKMPGSEHVSKTQCIRAFDIFLESKKQRFQRISTDKKDRKQAEIDRLKDEKIAKIRQNCYEFIFRYWKIVYYHIAASDRLNITDVNEISKIVESGTIETNFPKEFLTGIFDRYQLETIIAVLDDFIDCNVITPQTLVQNGFYESIDRVKTEILNIENVEDQTQATVVENIDNNNTVAQAQAQPVVVDDDEIVEDSEDDDEIEASRQL